MNSSVAKLVEVPVCPFPNSGQFVDWLKCTVPLLPVNLAQIGQRARPDLGVRSASNLVADMVAGKWNKIGLDQAGAVLGAVMSIADENSIVLPPFTVTSRNACAAFDLELTG